ncbi:MAG: response regulator [Candidatus Omnitrophota bacterium]|nr:response regulator [Candidatus Omnitrophota bacterium]
MEKILIVDDDADHLETLGKILELAGYEVIKESEARKVLKIAQEQNPSLIMMDVRMPQMSGFELARELKSDEVTKDMVMLIFSAVEKSGEMFKKVLEVGAEDFISMPAEREEIVSRVKVCLQRKKYIADLKQAEEALRLAYNKLRETQSQLIQAEKLNAIGRLASGVAHEVRNPLSVALQAINYLEKIAPYQAKDTLETLSLLKENIKKADEIVRLLLDFSRSTLLNLQLEDINTIVEKSLELARHRFRLENIEIIKEIKMNIPKVLVDKNKIEQVFVNIFLNSIQAMPQGGKIFIRIYKKQFTEVGVGIGRRVDDRFSIGEEAIIVETEDTGVGIPEENLSKIFDPFFTTKGPAGGCGLGLSVSRSIIDMHRGLIDIESQAGKGTKVIVTLKKEE